ncbi:MAG: GntR family transcriptional regulator [Acidothermales bacterium]|nr:GntR family transcriptional regulator [Acidothermales bacterium]
MTPRPIERPVPLRQSVYDALIELIIVGSLPPGQHLVESELARHLGVSRQPVREALHRLQAEGWIDLRPGQGAFVHVPTDEEVDQLLTVRSLLEGGSARLAARVSTPEQIEHLRELVRAGEAALAEEHPEVESLVASNAEFHSYVTRMASNTVLAELITLVDRRIRWYYAPLARHRGHDSWDEHTELVDALAAHDEDRAAAIARDHSETTRATYHDLKAAGELEL